MATVAIPKVRITGGSFLLEERNPNDVFTPEDFSEEHLQIAKTAEEFATNEIVPAADKLEHKEWALARESAQDGQRPGLEFGGHPRSRMAARTWIRSHPASSPTGSRSTPASPPPGARTPASARCPSSTSGPRSRRENICRDWRRARWIGAYALSESSSGSDALNCRARAQLSPDGKHYILNGEKMWITNAGFADLFIVFAKVDGEKFTAFMVEKNFPRLRGGRGRAQDGHPRLLHLSADPYRLPGARGEPAGRDRQRPHHRFQHSQRWPLQAGRQLRGRRSQLAAVRHRVRQAAQGLRQSRSPTSGWCARSWPTWRSASSPASPWCTAPSA